MFRQISFLSSLSAICVLFFPAHLSAAEQSCTMTKSKMYDGLLNQVPFMPSTKTSLESARSIKLNDDTLTIAGWTIDLRSDGKWKKFIRVECEKNGNDWSPCGSPNAVFTLQKINANKIEGSVLIPWEYGTLYAPSFNVEYVCSTAKSNNVSVKATNNNSVQYDSIGSIFKSYSITKRKEIQSILKEQGFYKSSIDGLYGKGTAAALKSYNKQNFGGVDLKKNNNVSKLVAAILALKPRPTLKPNVIQADQSDKTYKVASGTGFYISDKGHIITNHHVVDGCRDIKVQSKGRMLETTQLAGDEQNDLALLKVSEAPGHVFALSTNSPFPLQEIIVAGFPFGDNYSSALKFTQGIVSSLTGMNNNYSEIQIDAALQQGNSGGPIIDEYGNIVAVAVAKLDAKYMFDNFGIIPENTNFGVKASSVRQLMEGNGIPLKSPSIESISRQDLSKQTTDGTVLLTCWMTMAQVQKLRSKKVMFEDLE